MKWWLMIVTYPEKDGVVARYTGNVKIEQVVKDAQEICKRTDVTEARFNIWLVRGHKMEHLVKDAKAENERQLGLFREV
jgi:hypothetical protein